MRGGGWGGGETLPTAGPTPEGGITGIDVWNSREDFDRFLQGRLGEAIQEAGVPQPQIREIPVHNEVRG